MQKIKRLENYIFEFFSERFESFDWKYKIIHKHRHQEIYLLEHGTKLMDFIMGIHCKIKEQFYFKQLIPQKFATPANLLAALRSFKSYLNTNQKFIDSNLKGEDTNYIVVDLLKMKTELIEMIDYCIEVYDQVESNIPYQDLKFNLISKNIDEFISNLKSILASVSYSISKTKEGYHHSNVHLILKLLGFDIISEEETNIGRIDAVIRFTNVIYIIEFKFDNSSNSKEKALKQIIDKKYHEKFIIDKKEVIAVGISFSDKHKNISGYSYEKIV